VCNSHVGHLSYLSTILPVYVTWAISNEVLRWAPVAIEPMWKLFTLIVHVETLTTYTYDYLYSRAEKKKLPSG